MIPVPKYCAMCSTALVRRIPELDNRERHLCPDCGYVHYLQPKIAAGAIPEQDGKIVLIQRGVGPRKGYWSFPCGFMEIDEDVSTAAKRETEEETGLRVELLGHLGNYSYAKSDHGGSIVIVVYRAKIVGGELKPDDDVVDAKFVDPDEIPWDDLAFPSSHRAFKDWLKQHNHG